VFSKWTAAEIERSQAEERFSTAFHNSPEGCAIASLRTGRFIEANDSFLRMLEYERDEVIDVPATELRHWEDPQARSEILRKIQETGRVQQEAVKFRTKRGRIIQARFSGEVIQLRNEPCLLGIARDVTEQNVLEEKFRQSQKMEAVAMLAGGVAHDFNNLLGVIIGYGEMLSTSAAPNSPTLKKIEAIKQAAQRAAMLTTQLLAYSRKQAVQPRISNLNSIVSETEKMLRRLIGENIELVVMLEPNLDYINVDPGQMVQVLMNLAVNARDAMSKKGKLIIETANIVVGESAQDGIAPGHYVRLSVSDTGMGMDEATKSRIFEPFFTTKEPGHGTGLGLATVYGIVEQSGGRIIVESELEAGTKFEIHLPSVEKGVPAQETEAAGSKTISGSATILLVEDEVAMRMVLDESLRAEGYRVLAAGNGLDALRIAEQHQGTIDLLITDVIMPAMSGPEVAQALATSRPATPVLYISGYTADKLTHYPELEHDVALLQKPFKLNVLAQKVRDIIGTMETA
jgi:two-component system, cell cycle sensor histidine kinase and response regulator CckA